MLRFLRQILRHSGVITRSYFGVWANSMATDHREHQRGTDCKASASHLAFLANQH